MTRIMARVTIASETSGSVSYPWTPPPSSEPAERPFDHPSPRLHDEAGASCEPADDDQRQAEQEAGQHRREAVVDAVREHGPEPGVERLDTLEQVREAVGVPDVGRVHDRAEQQVRILSGISRRKQELRLRNASRLRFGAVVKSGRPACRSTSPWASTNCCTKWVTASWPMAAIAT